MWLRRWRPRLSRELAEARRNSEELAAVTT